MTKKSKSGDTLIEVLLGITIFAAIAVAAISVMSAGVNSANRAIEVQYSRDLISSQMEILRFLKADHDLGSEYINLWEAVNALVIENSGNNEDLDLNLSQYNSCEKIYEERVKEQSSRAFVFNPRFIESVSSLGVVQDTDTYKTIILPEIIISDTNRLVVTDYYPNIEYTALNFSRDFSEERNFGWETTNTHNSTGFDYENSDWYKHIVSVKDTPFRDRSHGLSDAYMMNDYIRANEGRLERKVLLAKGVWNTLVRVQRSTAYSTGTGASFDLYGNTCWETAGSRTHSTLTIITRFEN